MIEKELVRSATEANDNARIVLYGERVLQRESSLPDEGEVMQMLDQRRRALLVDKSDSGAGQASHRVREAI